MLQIVGWAERPNIVIDEPSDGGVGKNGGAIVNNSNGVRRADMDDEIPF